MLTNRHKIAIPIAIWLATDDYDYVHDPKYISATSLLKSTKSIVLSKRVNLEEVEIDIAGNVASRVGTAVHDSIEKTWMNPEKVRKAFKALGYPEALIKRIVVNPKELKENDVPVYMEIRSIKEIDGYKIGGKFDFVIEGQLTDFKTTKAFTYIKKSNDEKYMMQGSIYRWLNPDIITNPVMHIEYLFTDWSAIKAMADKTYPKFASMTQPFEMLSIEQTESFIRTKLAQVTSLMDKPEAALPACTKEELWQDETTFAYYKDKTKLTRATRVLPSMMEAQALLAKNGGNGIVVTRPGEARACKYCDAVTVCNQAKTMLADGILKL